MDEHEQTWVTVMQALLTPFDPDDVEVLERGSSGRFPYLKAEAIEGRLDSVPGLTWDFALLSIGEHALIGTLTLRAAGETVTRMDVGEWSRVSTGDSGRGMTDTIKAAATDAFKRATARAGIGRFLNYLPRGRSSFTASDLYHASVKAGWVPTGPPPAAPADRHPGPHAGAPPSREGAPTAGACVFPGCGLALTAGQVAVSRRAFNQDFCPTHQKTAARPV